MGKKIILTESQFKEYVKSQLNESMGEGEDIVDICSDYADRLRVISDQVRELGNQYSRFYKIAREELENMSIAVKDVRDCKIYGDFGVMMYVDTSMIQLPEDYQESDRDLYIQNEVEDRMNGILSSPMGLGAFFKRVTVYFKNGVVEIVPEPKDWLSLERVYDFLSSN